MGEVVLVAMTALPWATVVVAVTLGRRRVTSDTVARVATWMTGTGFAIAVLAAVLTLTTAPVTVQFGASGVQLDPLSVVLSVLVLGLSSLIQSFAVRYLRGDRRQGWFVASATTLTAATVLLVCAASLVVFGVAWVVAGAALIAALATYPHLEQAREGMRRTAMRFVIADAALLIALAIMIVSGGGDRPLNQLTPLAASLGEPLSLTAAVLLVIGALARSSQLPFQGWLPFTLSAPTPVSALMHAGVVNAGAIVLVRFAPVISVHAWLMVAIVLIGGATVVWASAARLVRPDVKGRLVYSTMAQMGFMIMACGLGAYAAAIFHLIAHSLFKSSRFLGAGMGVRRYIAELSRPASDPARGARRALALVIAVVVPLGGLIGAEVLLAPSIAPANIALLAFVAATGAVTLGATLVGRFTLATALVGVTGMLALILSYAAFLGVFSAALSPEPAVAPAPAWLVALPAAGLLMLEILSRTRAPSRVRDRVYARALTTSTTRLTLAKGLTR